MNYTNITRTIRHYMKSFSEIIILTAIAARDSLTCYTHLKSRGGHLSVCLDRTEICNGKFNYLKFSRRCSFESERIVQDFHYVFIFVSGANWPIEIILSYRIVSTCLTYVCFISIEVSYIKLSTLD